MRPASVSILYYRVVIQRESILSRYICGQCGRAVCLWSRAISNLTQFNGILYKNNRHLISFLCL